MQCVVLCSWNEGTVQCTVVCVSFEKDLAGRRKRKKKFYCNSRETLRSLFFVRTCLFEVYIRTVEIKGGKYRYC